MVQVAGMTYRVARVGTGLYEVVRILDDAPVGMFLLGPPLEVRANALGAAELRQIAQAAIRDAKTTWVGAVRANLPV